MNGLILINKPQNYTSFDVVASMRKICNQKKVGHTGTLDPMATGVLPILLGNATKAQSILPNNDKKYSATFKLGITTDTQDITGKILSTSDVKITINELQSTLNSFIGEIKQTPPMYSALKQKGVKLYELARKGINIERESRIISIYELKLIDFNQEMNTVKIDVKCSKGTYIRTLCHDIGESLGCGATLIELCRTCACGFNIDDCITIDNAKALASKNLISSKLITTDILFDLYKPVKVSINQSVRFKNGGSLDISRTSIEPNIKDKSIIRVYGNDDSFIGLGIILKEKNELQIYKLFNNVV